MGQNLSETNSEILKENENDSNNAKRKKVTKTGRLYIPKYQSGSFALLVGLYKAAIMYGLDYFVSKNELISLSQPYCSTSLDSVAKRQGVSSKYCIGDHGIEPAQKIVSVLIDTQKTTSGSSKSNSNSATIQNNDPSEIIISVEDMELFEKGEDMFKESRISIDQQDNESFENEISNYSDGYNWSSQNYEYTNGFNSTANSSQNPLNLDSDKSSFDGRYELDDMAEWAIIKCDEFGQK
ncbi:Crossover junction endonuclease mus81 [Smittium culicis]|uniref:Crossover junction endonuclease mus81 n=1 Tax=Smittium culicis TaxID=133412 RepID=A0A1R1X5V5_9FUNG|nr:Crossover junction endonuclease mus81 [Smittium culicis]